MQDLTNNRMVLDFQVNKQTLERIDNNRPVANSKNYLYAKFTFTADWENTEKIATFKWGDIMVVSPLDENNTCKVANDVIKASGFYVMVRGEINNEVVMITSSPKYVGVTDTLMSEGSEAPIRYINTNTLDFTKNGDLIELNIPNSYGVSLTLDENGVVSLQGRNGVVLSQIDLPTEKVIKNVSYDNENKSLVFEFENSNNVIVPIGDLFDNENYYTKQEIQDNYQPKLTQGEGINIDENGVISISYANGDDLTYGD